MRERLTIDPGQLVRVGPHVQDTTLLGRLHVREEENMVARPTISVQAVLEAWFDLHVGNLARQAFGDGSRVGQEIGLDMLDSICSITELLKEVVGGRPA